MIIIIIMLSLLLNYNICSYTCYYHYISYDELNRLAETRLARNTSKKWRGVS